MSRGEPSMLPMPARRRDRATGGLCAAAAPRRRSRPRVAMVVSLDLLVNAIVAGILLGGFYAAVSVGITISFGMLDIANIAQPAFILLGSYAAYIFNSDFGIDPILIGFVMMPVFYVLGMAVYRALLPCVRAPRRAVDPGPRLLFRPVVRRRSVAGADLRRRLPLCRGAAISARACISASSTCRCAC